MAGLLAGAMQGLGQGMAIVGQSGLEEKRAARLEEMRQRYQVQAEQRQAQRQDQIRSEDRGWQLEDYDRQRGDAVEDRDISFEHATGLAQMHEAGADRRSGAQIEASNRQRPQWQMVPDGNGGYIQYDPISNDYRPANLPEGVSFNADNGQLTDREKAQIDMLGEERKMIMEQSMGQPNEQQAARLGEIESRLESMLGGGGGGSLAERLTRQLGIDPNTQQQGQPAQADAPPGSAPPRPGQQPPQASAQELPSNFGGLINQAMAGQEQQRAERQSTTEQRQIERQINTIRGLASRAGQGPGMTQADRDALGRQAIEQAEALMQQGNLTSEQINRLRAAAENVVRYTELDFN